MAIGMMSNMFRYMDVDNNITLPKIVCARVAKCIVSTPFFDWCAAKQGNATNQPGTGMAENLPRNRRTGLNQNW